MQYNKLELMRLLDLVFGIPGRLLDMSKRNPNIIYNANLIVDKEKVWYGDLSVQENWKLRDLASLLNKKVYLLREMDARFETENNPRLENAVLAYDENGKEIKMLKNEVKK